MIKAFVFDMDGILLDSETICDIAWDRLAGEMKLPDIKLAINRCRGCNKTDSSAILKDFYGQDFDSKAFLQKTSEIFHEIEGKGGIPLLPYAKEILEYLKPKYRLALASSTRQVTASRQLKAAGIYDYFESFIFGDMVEHSKPEPEIYLKACESLGLSPRECAAVEDSPNGIKSAASAGLSVIMVPDKIQPDDKIKEICTYIFKSLREIEAHF